MKVRGIPRDTWNMFLNFTIAVGSDLSQYDDTEAWPRCLFVSLFVCLVVSLFFCLLVCVPCLYYPSHSSLFDDFVEFENDQLNQNVGSVQDRNRESSNSPL